MVKDLCKNIYGTIVRNFYTKPRYLMSLFIHPAKYCSHKSYFPDKRRKSNFTIWIDQLIQTLKYGYPNEFYFPYGFDVKTKTEMSEYLHYAPFMQKRDSRNIMPHSATAVLRDKVLFGMFTSYFNIASARNIAFSTVEGIYNIDSKKFVSIGEFISTYEGNDLFAKPIDGECGHGILRFNINKGRVLVNGDEMSHEKLNEIFSSVKYLLQLVVNQHEAMSSLHSQSINTIRLVTMRNPSTGHPEVFPSILRIGTGNSIVDNTSQGGLAVGIDLSTGRLKEYGFYKPAYGTKTSIHPDSKIKFTDFVIPYFEECKKQAIFLHSMLPNIHSIGWDISIGESGPIFIEGNDNWEINGPQICNGGLKELFYRYF